MCISLLKLTTNSTTCSCSMTRKKFLCRLHFFRPIIRRENEKYTVPQTLAEEKKEVRKVEKIGIIDLGSNTARLVIVDMFTDGHYMVVDELKESVRLGQDMERDGFLKPQRIAETIRTLKMFKRLCDASGVDRIIAVGTAAVRRAKNQRSFLDEIQVTCNITVRVLSEEEEALLVYRGVINSMDIPKGLILEIGGGSTKIVYYNRRNMLNYATLPFGAVTLTDLFANDATPEESARHVEEFFTEQLKKLPWLAEVDPETQVILPMLKTDLMEIFEAIVEERLSEIKIEWEDGACVCLVLASGGYPEHYEKGKEITFRDLDDDIVVYHAGTAMKDGKIVTSGGRVLGVVAKGVTVEEARQKVYANAQKINFDGMYYRNDIGIKYRDIVKY